MTSYVQHLQNTTQVEQEHPDQSKNNAGGYSFTLDKWKRLERFLILGAEGGTYYVQERKLTRDNAGVIRECLKDDPVRTVNAIVEVSDKGRAPKNDPAIFALAIAASEGGKASQYALSQLRKVCRTGTHLFQFAESVNALRGWGRGLCRAVANWYLDRPVDHAAHQAVKYQQRNGWSHRDLLRLSHAKPTTPEHQGLFQWIAKGELSGSYPAILGGYEALKAAQSTADVVALIQLYGFTHEMIPSRHKNAPEVWEALLPKMPMTATIRNLGKLSSIGLLSPGSSAARLVKERITNADALRKARVHPIAILSALKVYSQGHGERGKLSWTAVPSTIDALDEAFYLAFEAVEPTGKRMMLALDVSGSMGWSPVPGLSMSARDVSAAMSMATARTEDDPLFVCFSHELRQLPITKRQRIDDVVNMISDLPFGRTDCSLPMRAALANKLEVDTFVVYTDNETWAGPEHPYVSLERYRQMMGRNAKLVVCGTTATEFTIANPNDAGMLDVVGFSANCPAVLAEFARGE